MVSRSNKTSLAAVGGMLVIVLFCIFTLASAVRYPTSFTPMDNWLSDLGAPAKNPTGDVYFNVGCILTGSAMLLVMWGLGVWNGGTLLTAGRACGVISAFALMLIGIFVEGTGTHSILALTFFLFLFFFLVLTNLALRKDPAYNKLWGYYVILAVILDVIFIYTFFAYEQAPVWEWLVVFSALLWVVMLSYDTFRLEARSPKN
jgi:hypothetical membrane protein